MKDNIKNICECIVICLLSLCLTYTFDKTEQRDQEIKIKEIEIKQKLNC